MIDVLKPLIKQFLPFAQEKMGFERPPRLFLKQDAENAANPLGKTGFYDPQAESITLFITGRHPKDVMRSLSHELMHHTQKCNGEFENVENMGEQGYAQNNPHMRTMEIHAYQASIVFRDWEDSIKGTIYNESLQKGANENMSTKNWKNNELKTLMTEKWGFKMDLDKLNESQDQQALEESPEAEEGPSPGLELYEMCPDGPHEHPEEDIEGEMEGEVEGDVESLATKALQAIADLAAAAGADVSTSLVPAEEEDELEERRGRGRADPRNQRGPADPRQRPVAEEYLRKAIRGNKLTKEHLRQVVRKTLELQQEQKSNKG